MTLSNLFGDRLLVAYLLCAARHGFLVVEMIKDRLQPSPLQLLREHELLSGEAEERPASWAMELEKKLVDEAQEVCQDLGTGPIRRIGNRFYLHRNYADETEVLEAVRARLNSKPTLSVDPELWAKAAPQNLLSAQNSAIEMAQHKCLMVLAGGPGTGKTFTAGHLIRRFQESACRPLRVAIAAPTGKAARHLEESLSKVCSGLEAKTLHRLLEVRVDGLSEETWEGRKLHHDLILVDECSMIDLEMMRLLLKSVKAGARLILMGDPNQLPAVDVGSVFGDFCSVAMPQGWGVTLTECMRAENRELIDLSRAIQDGAWAQVESLLEASANLTIRELPSSPKLLKNQLISHLLEKDPPCILSPLRKGLFGVDQLNYEIGKRFQGPKPVMMTRNHTELKLANGELGVLDQSNEVIRFGERAIPKVLIPHYEPAYCLSVHKSQGSEFGGVVVILPDGAEMFGREVLYTAVTRARQRITIYGKMETIRKTLERRSQRTSGLISRLNLIGD